MRILKFTTILLLAQLHLSHPTLLQSDLGKLEFRLADHNVDLTIEYFQKKPYLSLLDLQTVLGGRLNWIDLGLKIEWELKGNILTFENELVFFRFNERIYQLADPSFLYGTAFYLPVQFVKNFLPYLLPDSYRYVAATNTFHDSSEAPSLKSIRYRVDRGITKLLLELSAIPTFTVQTKGTRRLEIVFNRTEIAAGIESVLRNVGYIHSVKVDGNGPDSRLVLHLNGDARRYRVAEAVRPAGVSISIFGVTKPGRAANLPLTRSFKISAKKRSSTSMGSRSERPLPVRRSPGDYDIDTIVIDAGHGVKDPGAVSRGRIYEKDFNLLIALELEKLMRDNSNLKVILTRRDDTFIPLQKRTEIANRSKADLFLSIHCNANKAASLSGFETYFLSEAKTDDARAVALRENESLKYELDPADSQTIDNRLEDILADLAQNEYLRESSDWAEIIVQEMDKRLKTKNRGVKQAGFWVLNGAFMPAILHETAFLTNKDDQKRLKSSKFRRKVAQALYNAITKYIDRYQKKLGSGRQ